MDKEQRDKIIEGIEGKAKEQGLTMLRDIPAGAKATKWNLGRNAPETDSREKDITMHILSTEPGSVRGYVFLTYEDQDGEEGAGNFHGTTFFKVTG